MKQCNVRNPLEKIIVDVAEPFREIDPQSDDLVERINRTINRLLAKVLTNHKRDWGCYLCIILLTYSSTSHDNTS